MKLTRTNKRPSYWGPLQTIDRGVRSPEPPSEITADTTRVRADSTEYTADHEGQ